MLPRRFRNFIIDARRKKTMNFCDELAWTFGVASITEQRAQTYVRGTD